MAHDETGQCLVGDVVRIVETPPIDAMKRHAVAERVKPAEHFIDEKTKFVYTNGHLNIPVGYVNEEGKLINRVPHELYRKMGLI